MYPWRLHPDKISQPTNSVNIIIKHSHRNAQIQIHPGKITRPTNWIIIIIKHCQLTQYNHNHQCHYFRFGRLLLVIPLLRMVRADMVEALFFRFFSTKAFDTPKIWSCFCINIKRCSPERRLVRPTSRTSSSTSTSVTSCPQSNQNATLWNFLECHFDLKTLCQQNFCKLILPCLKETVHCSDWSLNTGYKLEYWLNTKYKLPSMKSPRCYQDAIREPRNGILDVKMPKLKWLESA